jgi:predicted nucleic acid-binding protein
MASLIDTDVMIDVSRGNASAASYLDSLSDPAISNAIRLGFELVSKNRKHFAMIDGLRLESPRY